MNDKQPITEAQFAERVQPALRLFLSVDLENSTKLKQGRDSKGETWLPVVLLFARSFPQLFEARLQAQARAQGRIPPGLPPLWKMLGDELIFVQSLQRATDAQVYMKAFRDALAEWNIAVTQGQERGPLFVKGAAWLAGFPIVNAVIDAGDNREDYIGPSIDAGFRVARLATPRRLPVSVDLAWLLLHIESDLLLHFDGPVMLKGVAEESGYPSFWLEVRASEYIRAEREMMGYGEQSDPQKMKRLCELFMAEFGGPRHLPFLQGDLVLAGKPDGYDDERRMLAEFYRRELYLVDGPEAPCPAPLRSSITPEALLQQVDETGQSPQST